MIHIAVPRALAADTLEKAAAREAAEEACRHKLDAGETTIELLNLKPYLDAAGITL